MSPRARRTMQEAFDELNDAIRAHLLRVGILTYVAIGIIVWALILAGAWTP